jgi:hypothetical protein
VRACGAGERWDNGRCRCVNNGSGARFSITVTRTDDSPVPCVDVGGGSFVCPEVAPGGNSWLGSVTLVDAGSAGWSVTIRRTGTDGGEVLWHGIMNTGDTEDFTAGMPAGIAPGGSFNIQVNGEEFGGGGGVINKSASCTVPSCDCAGDACIDPLTLEPVVCDEGQYLDTGTCTCEEDPCPGGGFGQWEACCNCCVDACGGGDSFSSVACDCCPSAGTLIGSSCEEGVETSLYHDGDCGTYEETTEC